MSKWHKVLRVLLTAVYLDKFVLEKKYGPDKPLKASR